MCGEHMTATHDLDESPPRPNAASGRVLTDGQQRTPPWRVLLAIGQPLANLVAVTLRHGSYETRDCANEAECQQIVRDWRPDMALIDIDQHFGLIEMLGGGMM